MNTTNHFSLRTRKIPFGVLSDQELLLSEEVQGKRVLHSMLLQSGSGEIGGLLEQLWNAEVSTVWVMPQTRMAQSATCAWLEEARPEWTMLIHADPHEPTRPVCAWFWSGSNGEQPGRRLALAFPGQAGWGWKLTDTTGLLATVTYLDQVLARPVIDHPDRLALQLLTELTRDQSLTHLRSSPVDLSTLVDSNGTTIPWNAGVSEISWMRPFTLIEQRQKYLHKYTHGFRSLQAAQGLLLGVGAPQHDPTGRRYDGKNPGLWRVQVERVGSVFDGIRLPAGIDGAWISTPQVRCCQAIGYQVSLQEGYYWPQAQEPLNLWAKTLWQAAETLHTRPQRFRHQQARANAIQTLSLLAHRGAYLLAHDQAASGWGRPDWWAQFVGRSRALLFAHLVQLVRKGTMPVLVTPDALWVVSNNLNPLSAVPGLVSAARWNGYAVGYTVPLSLSSEVRAIFQTGKTLQAEQAAHSSRALDALADEHIP
jgi:hypothetical protein